MACSLAGHVASGSTARSTRYGDNAGPRQDQTASILSPSAENDLRRTPINLNPYLRRSLLRALYHLEAEYQQQQALEAGRALSNGVPVIGEYHRTAPAVLKDPALRRALLRVLIHLEAEDLDKRAQEEAASELNAKEKQALRDAREQNNFLRNYMDENFPTDSPPQRDIPANMAEYIKYANEISGSHPGSVPAAGTQVNAYAEQPAPTQDQQYNGHQLPYNQQQQNYNQQQQNYNQQQTDAGQQYNQAAEAGLELQTALPSQNYDDTRLALNFQTDYTTQDPYSNHNYNATTEQPVPTTTDYYQTSPDPVQDDGRDNSIGKEGVKEQEQRSVNAANTIPTAETPTDTTALPTQDTTVEAAITTITTAKPASTTEDIKIFQAPLLAAFTLHQDAHGTPQRIVPLYRKQQSATASATASPTVATKLDEEQELKQQQLLLEEQLRRLQELQAKQQQLLKLQQFLTQEQERQRQLKKAHLAKAAATAAPQDQQQQQHDLQHHHQQQARVTAASVADSTYITQPPTTVPAPTAQPTLVAQSSTPEAAVQIHHSQGDTERQKQIEEYDKQRTLELERARKQSILEALERERQQKIIEAENARQRQLQQFYEEQHRLRLQEQERQRLASLDLTFQRSVEFNAA
ncbi:alpha-protein kinase 1-like, partial [Thrips palmi]|uniref:Alpha-protein kinase 1-like n=1 Tax=Thrips palmi TaxID=161013 RepID=A0A6P8ZSX9_THRPL